MKLSFSIQNWNELSWEMICRVAKETRVPGIELYDVKSPLFQGKMSLANPELAPSIRRSVK